MIAIGETLVSEDLLEKKFVCDLNACKGACCVQGDSGPPLEETEVKLVEEAFPYAKPYMTMEGIRKIEEDGVSIRDDDGDLVIPTVNGKHCAFVYFEKDVARCSLEKAFGEGRSGFHKPVSCHLFPVRVKKFPGYEAVNYEEREICKPACMCGEKMKTPVFRFLRDPLIKKFGENWFKQLEILSRHRST